MSWITITIESILFFIMLITVGYLFVFALYGLRKRQIEYKQAKKQRRIAVLFPCYMEDNVIGDSVISFLKQDYPQDSYTVVVICDRMLPETMELLSTLPVRILTVDFENSSKAKALNFALDSLCDEQYDIAVVLDADNSVETNFLTQINNASCAGIKAMQAHRVAKNRDTDTAVLDALSEEINNSIFRKGHVNLGFSSALIGSGMAFDYKWFRDNMKTVSSMGEDKELEMLLLSQGIYIDYLERVMVYDQKTQRSSIFYKQRRRWLAAQFEMLAMSLRSLPEAVANRNVDYCDKMLQWMMLPRSVVLGIIGVAAVVLTFVNWIFAVKWWVLLLLMLFTLSIATPDYLVDKHFYRAMRKLPLLSLMMVLNLLRLRGVSKRFIHTDH